MMPRTPIMGVDLTRYAAIRARLDVGEIAPERVVRIAAALGVDRAAWRLADAVWSARLQDDPQLRVEFARLVAMARQDRR